MQKFNSGLSLIELVLAVAILAFSMIPIAGIMGQGIKGTQKNYRTIVGIQLLKETLNKAISAKYADLPVGNQTSDISLSNGKKIQLGDIMVNKNKYTVSLNVTAVSVKFKYSPIDVSKSGFDPNAPSTWTFSSATYIKFDGSSIASAKRVKKVIANIKWTESNGAKKKYRLMSYVTRIKG